MRTLCGGRGCRSRPLGESQDVAVRFSAVVSLAPSLTFDLHFLSFLARSQNQFRAIEEAVYDVHVTFHAVVDHLLFAVASKHNQHRRFASFAFHG